MWFYFYRRMLRTPWTDRKRNEDVLKEINSKRQLHNHIRRRQSTFFGHIMRRGKMEHIVATGKLNGRRGRGRPREKIFWTTWCCGSGEHLHQRSFIESTRDRRLWTDMITNAIRHG